MCWYCHWGWPKPVADIYKKYVSITGEWQMHYGPGHIVWGDCNFNRDSVTWCVKNANEYRHEDSSDDQHAAVVQSLKDLLLLPDDVLDPAGALADNDEAHMKPSAYPPPPNLELVRN